MPYMQVNAIPLNGKITVLKHGANYHVVNTAADGTQSIPLNGKITVLKHGANYHVVNTAADGTQSIAPATADELKAIAVNVNQFENYTVSSAQLRSYYDFLGDTEDFPKAPVGVIVNNVTPTAFSVGWSSETDSKAKYWVVRVGVNGDGKLDTDLIGASSQSADITEADLADIAPIAGKLLDIYVAEFNKVYTTPTEALESDEYNEATAWSTLVTQQIPTA